MTKQLYFDIAATTPMDIAVAEIVHKANIENFKVFTMNFIHFL